MAHGYDMPGLVLEASAVSIDETPCKLEKAEHIGEVAHQTHGDTHRARAFSVNAQAKIIQGQPLLGLVEACHQLSARQTESDFAAAGVQKQPVRNEILALLAATSIRRWSKNRP
jgi:hypothetical protein